MGHNLKSKNLATLLLGYLMLFHTPPLKAQDEIDYRPKLLKYARSYDFTRLENFDDGIAARKGARVLYVAHESQVSSEDEFYWTMVRVLSEKYACFMKERTKGEDYYSFVCRDGRRVMIRHGQTGSLRYFTAIRS